jgi:hypothetical protein
MRWPCVLLLFLLSATALRAQEHCPPNGQEKSGGNPSITWTSYMVKTPEGICLERSIRTRSETYIKWAVADINGVWVNKTWSSKRCCFSDSTVEDGELEYGVLGSKIRTTVYEGFHELPETSTFAITGDFGTAEKPGEVDLLLTTTAPVPCAEGHGPCRSRTYFIKETKGPVIVRWNGDLGPGSSVTAPNGSKGILLGSGKTATLELELGPGSGNPSLTVYTPAGSEVLKQWFVDTQTKQ